MDFDIVNEPLGNDKSGKPVYLREIWPTPQEVESTVRGSVTKRNVRKEYAEVFAGDAHWQRAARSRRRSLRVGREIHLHQEPAVLRGHAKVKPGALSDMRGAARAGCSRRQRHDRPHFSRRLDSAGQPCRKIPDREWRAAEGFQFLRRAPRQSRSDDARHVCEHPLAQPARARHRGRLDDPSAQRREDVHLRCGHEIPRRGRAAA